tara:strand:- start:831 stop:1277 length:447 start_codon:yes stop_codon:yes gene_type:complete
MASGLYALSMEQNLEQVTNFQIDFNDTTADRFKCLLTTASYTPNYSTHSIYSDVTNQLPATGGYVDGGESLTSITFATSGGTITWDAADVEWTASTLTGAAFAVIYDDSLTGKPLICCIDFGGAFSTTSGTFKITWNPSGIFTLDLEP